MKYSMSIKELNAIIKKYEFPKCIRHKRIKFNEIHHNFIENVIENNTEDVILFKTIQQKFLKEFNMKI